MEKGYTEDEQEDEEKWKKGKITAINPIYLIKGFALSALISGYILGPLLVLGGAGYFIYKYFKTPKIVLFISIILAFGISNILIFTRAKKDAEKMIEQTKDADKKDISN